MPRNRLCQIAAAAAIVFVMTGAVPDARAAVADAASAPAEASAPLAAGSQYTIHPGQSLNDVAIAATQSHDPATLVRASRALFDANPNAFMAHDPSRLRLGAVLTIPALDATGAAVEASGASAATATAASGSAQAAMATAASGAAQPQPQQAVIAQANPASAAQQGTPGTANAASESLQANPVAAGVAGASAAASASATASVAASAAVGVSSASSAAAPVPASQASGAHVWTGSIQPSASAAASASGSAAAGQATTQVSSLQQLLALKSRVLMELQKHGIGGGTATQPSGGAVTAAGGQAGAAHGAASGSAAANIGMANGHPATDAGLDSSSTNLGIAAAIGAALVALLAGLGLRRRKRAAGAAEAADAAVTARAAALVTPPVPSEDGEEEGEAAAGERAVVDEAVEHQVAGAEATEADEVAHEANSQATTAQEAAAQEAAAQEEAAPQETSADDAAIPSASASQSPAAASQKPAAYDPAAFPANRPLQQSADEFAPVASEPATFERPPAEEAPEQASQELTRAPEHQGFELPPASSLDLGAASAESTVPPEPSTSAVEPSDRGTLAESPTGEQTAHTPSEEAASTEPPAGYNSLQPQIHSGAPEADQHSEPNHGQVPTEPVAAPAESSALSDENAFAAESHTNEDEGQWGTPEAFPLPEPLDPFPAELAAPKGFPREAVDAFGSLDLGLPPRIDSDAAESPPVSLDTHPVVEPEISAQQAIAPPPAVPLQVADEIAAGTAGAAAVAGLGAARFGALNLDFDLELPPSPAQPLPLFTPEDLGRIARNKLDLASEYIELGDLAGARALIHEVIEANDATTRSEARALLSTLAPLS